MNKPLNHVADFHKSKYWPIFHANKFVRPRFTCGCFDFLCVTDEISYEKWERDEIIFDGGRLLVAVRKLPNGKVVPYHVEGEYNQCELRCATSNFQ